MRMILSFVFVVVFFGFLTSDSVFAESLGEKIDITEAVFDKSSYQKGDTILVNLDWETNGLKVVSHDNKDGEVIIADLVVFMSDGTPCGPTVSKSVFSEDTQFLIATVASVDCLDPQARISFIGTDARLLDVAVISSISDAAAPLTERTFPNDTAVIEGREVVMKDGAVYISSEIPDALKNEKSFLRSGAMIVGAVSVIGLIALIVVLVWRTKKQKVRNF